ncbi:hypothetical protein LINGRAHAP2_LOCUS30851 [Linum grandiflorum]
MSTVKKIKKLKKTQKYSASSLYCLCSSFCSPWP